jgi:hypothetical protein
MLARNRNDTQSIFENKNIKYGAIKMFILRISETFENEIHVEGDAKVVNNLHETLKKSGCWIKEKQEYGFSDGKTCVPHASFSFGIWNLKYKFKMNDLLSYIQSLGNEAQISARDLYLLEYWNHEIQMIASGKSYRSKLAESSQGLASPKTLNTILDRYKAATNDAPTYEKLFNLLETSSQVIQTAYISPPLPYEYELEKFIPKKITIHLFFISVFNHLSQNKCNDQKTEPTYKFGCLPKGEAPSTIHWGNTLEACLEFIGIHTDRSQKLFDIYKSDNHNVVTLHMEYSQFKPLINEMDEKKKNAKKTSTTMKKPATSLLYVMLDERINAQRPLLANFIKYFCDPEAEPNEMPYFNQNYRKFIDLSCDLLVKAGISTNKNRASIVENPYPATVVDITSSLELLIKNKISSQINFNTLISGYRRSYYGLKLLNDANLLTQQNFDAVTSKNADPSECAETIVLLHHSKILNVTTRTVTQDTDFVTIYDAVKILSDAKVLTLNNFNTIREAKVNARESAYKFASEQKKHSCVIL